MMQESARLLQTRGHRSSVQHCRTCAKLERFSRKQPIRSHRRFNGLVRSSRTPKQNSCAMSDLTSIRRAESFASMALARHACVRAITGAAARIIAG